MKIKVTVNEESRIYEVKATSRYRALCEICSDNYEDKDIWLLENQKKLLTGNVKIVEGESL